MASLSERLVNIAADNFDLEDQQPLLRAAAVCAAVEAFQAADKAYREALTTPFGDFDRRIENARDECEARLLEVDLG